jgi:hypothetical protein
LPSVIQIGKDYLRYLKELRRKLAVAAGNKTTSGNAGERCFLKLAQMKDYSKDFYLVKQNI